MGKFLKKILFQLTTLLLFVFLSNSIFAQSPVANFSGTPVSGCAPLVVNFQDLSTGNPFSWNWDFGNGQLSNVKNPVVSFAQPGTYSIRLIVRNAAGIDDEIKTDYITVFPSPSANFTANLTTACVPATIQFTDQSAIPPGAGFITDWLWDFGDGSTSTQQNPSHTYSTTGYFNVSLRITSSTGCQSFVSAGRYIRIISGINVDFTYSEPGTCQPPFLINFQDQSNGPGTLNYSWDFGNGGPGSGLQNPSSSYVSAGTYPVRLTVQSNLGCTGSLTKDIIISGKTTDFNFPANICKGASVTFQNNSSPSPVSSFWNFGDGTTSSQINPSKTFLNGGTFPVTLINNYGNCTDSITKNVTITSQPLVDFSAIDSTGCKAPFTVQFNDLSPIASTWLWDFGDGNTSGIQNPSHTYSNEGLFTVTLTITLPGGCSNSITKSQYIKIQPTTVSISNAPAGGCIPFTYNPVPSIQTTDSILTYAWDLGEPGATYNTQFPSHTYSSAGNYTISLTVTTQTGCTESITIPNGVRTGVPPTADFSFTPNNVCASTPVMFTDLSATSAGAFVSWLWDFGDGQTSNLQNPQHTYSDTGTLNVNLTVLNNGCQDNITKQIQIIPPVAKFGYSVNCNNKLLVTFLDSSLTSPVYGAITYEWRMGDPLNTVFFGPLPPTFTYPAYGTYTATLLVSNGPCSYTTTKDIVLVNETPAFNISKNPVCKNEIFTLSATGSNPAHIKNYSWTIGASTFNNTSGNFDHSLPAYGTYDVTLQLEDINGCLTSVTVNNFITVSGPVANFVPGTPGSCVNNGINFNDLSTSGAAPIVQWTWNFGEGTLQTFNAPPFVHTYSQTGSYSVSLMIKDNNNCTDNYTLPAGVIITKPVAAFRADTFYCPQAPLQFIDTSSGVGLSYNWYFGDGGNSTLQNPLHSYPPGNNSYSVKLVISDTVGCTDSVSKNAYIKIRSPKSAFSISDSAGICLPLQTGFQFQGSDYQNFFWDFGDGTISTAANPSHFYNSYGIYTPKLYVSGPGGCIDSAQATVNLYDPSTSTQISINPLSACNSLTANYTISTPPGFNYTLYFGDGTFDTTRQTNLSHDYLSPGNYYPNIQLTDQYGCRVVKSTPVINVYGAIPLFDKDKKEFCDNGVVNFINYTLTNDPIISSVWDFGDGNTSTANDPTHVFASPGTYFVKLTTVTQNQCTSSYTDTIFVYKTPDISITGKDTVCIKSPETYSGLITVPDSTVKWLWTLGNGSTSQLQNVTTSYSSPGNFSIQLLASNKLGCADTASFTVYASPLPTAAPVTDPITIISGGSAQLNMSYTGAIVSYNWLPLQHLDCTTCPVPVANPQFTTKYAVAIQDRYGCNNTGEVTVQVVCTNQNYFIPNTFSPNGDGSNDIFYPRGAGLFRIKTFRIFNRWGELVFEKRNFLANDASSGWDGTFKGKSAKPDVYIYQLDFICNNGETVRINGNIALIK